MEKKAIALKEKMELGKVIACLEDIVASLNEGTMCIQYGEDLITLKPTGNVDLEIEAVVKKGKEKLVLELSWQNDSGRAKEVEEKEFRIMSSEPVEEATVS